LGLKIRDKDSSFSLIRFPQTTSTSDEARLVNEEWTVIVAEEQTKGRGKPGSAWYSPKGGLYFSIVLMPKKDITDLLPLTLLTAKVLASLIPNSEIKLPNDILIAGKKVCGILTEKSGKRLIIGIGVNTNIRSFPKELEGKATSLLIESGREIDREDFLSGFLSAFKKEYDII